MLVTKGCVFYPWPPQADLSSHGIFLKAPVPTWNTGLAQEAKVAQSDHM